MDTDKLRKAGIAFAVAALLGLVSLGIGNPAVREQVLVGVVASAGIGCLLLIGGLMRPRARD